MKKATLALVGMGAALLMLGAGCNQAADTLENTTINTKDAGEIMGQESNTSSINISSDNQPENKPDVTPPADAKPVSMVSGDLALSAQALGDGAVRFSWSAPDDLTDANRFILVQGDLAYPEHDGKHNWFRQFYTDREMTWTGLLSGVKHFRICLTENKQNDICTKYSNDVEVEVK